MHEVMHNSNKLINNLPKLPQQMCTSLYLIYILKIFIVFDFLK